MELLVFKTLEDTPKLEEFMAVPKILVNPYKFTMKV